jgi:hypothetical protein
VLMLPSGFRLAIVLNTASGVAALTSVVPINPHATLCDRDRTDQMLTIRQRSQVVLGICLLPTA